MLCACVVDMHIQSTYNMYQQLGVHLTSFSGRLGPGNEANCMVV